MGIIDLYLCLVKYNKEEKGSFSVFISFSFSSFFSSLPHSFFLPIPFSSHSPLSLYSDFSFFVRILSIKCHYRPFNKVTTISLRLLIFGNRTMFTISCVDKYIKVQSILKL